MKNWLKKYIPNQKSIKKKKEFKILKYFLQSPSFFSFDCQSVARGMAAGLASAVIPGFQIFYAIILVILFRGNLPIALVATLITNPFTVIPIMFFICYVGSFILGNGGSNCIINTFNWNFSNFHVFWINFTTWVLQFGKSFFVGVPIVSIILAIIGYFGTLLIWKICIFLSSKQKK